MKRAFTLIELIVVIGIIAVLAGILLSQFRGAQDSARMAKCESNLRNLGMAANAVRMSSGYPHAGSTEYSYTRRTGRKATTYYAEHKGWISWLSEGKYTHAPTTHQSIQYCSFACDDQQQRNYAITNGAIWTAIGGNMDCYVCPCHRVACASHGGARPLWSYAMNARFGFDYSKGGEATDTQGGGIYSLARADRTLMFAEIPCVTADEAKNARPQVKLPNPVLSGSNGDSASDSVLQYEGADEWTGSSESIGFNHKAGKRFVGLVCFADGHTERINAPQDGKFNELTKWLCEGTDVTFVNGSYEHFTGAENSDASDN